MCDETEIYFVALFLCVWAERASLSLQGVAEYLHLLVRFPGALPPRENKK